MPEKPSAIEPRRKSSRIRNGSVPLTPASTGVVLHHRQHLARHVHHDLVGVAVGHQPGERAAPGHAVAAGVVDDDEVDAAGLLALRREPGAGAAADDGLAARDHRAELRQDLGAGDARHRCLPREDSGRVARRAHGHFKERRDERVGEGFVVDVQRQADQLAVGPGAEVARDRVEQRRSAVRIPERAARARRGRRRRPRGSGSAPGPSMRLSFARDELADARALLGAWCASASRSGCARGGCARGNCSGTVSMRPEVHHVERAAGADVGHRRARERVHPRPGRPTARRRRSRRRSRSWSTSITRGEQSRLDQLLHRLPAGAGRVEHEAVVVRLEPLRDRLHAGRREAEHGEADRRAATRRRSSPCRRRRSCRRARARRSPSTRSEMRLMPATSVTEYIMQMSAGPT